MLHELRLVFRFWWRCITGFFEDLGVLMARVDNPSIRVGFGLVPAVQQRNQGPLWSQFQDFGAASSAMSFTIPSVTTTDWTTNRHFTTTVSPDLLAMHPDANLMLQRVTEMNMRRLDEQRLQHQRIQEMFLTDMAARLNRLENK